MTNKIKRQDILELLSNNHCMVTFTKVDGSLREMPCTLQAHRLPPQKVTESKKPRPVNEAVVSAFCTDKGEWRSFRIDNVVSVTIIE